MTNNMHSGIKEDIRRKIMEQVVSLWNRISVSMTDEESGALNNHINLTNLARGLESVLSLPANISKQRLERIRHVLLFGSKLEQLSKEDYVDIEKNDKNSYLYNIDPMHSPPRDRQCLFSFISFLQQILGPTHALYRLNDMLAYSPRSQLFLGMRKLCKMQNHYFNDAKLACIDSLLESDGIAHLRACSILYFQNAGALSNRIRSYLYQFEELPKRRERVYDGIFGKLDTINYRDIDGIDLVFSHKNPEELFSGLKMLLKHYSKDEDDSELIFDYIKLLLNEQTSPEIIAEIIINIGQKAFDRENVLQELERLLASVNRDLAEYRSYWDHQKSKAEQEHNMFMAYMRHPNYLLYLRDTAVDQYLDLQQYLENICHLEYLGDKNETYQNKLNNLQQHPQQRFDPNWVEKHLSYVENESYQARVKKIEELESNTNKIMRSRLKHLVALIGKSKKNINIASSKSSQSRSSPLIINSNWASNPPTVSDTLDSEDLPQKKI